MASITIRKLDENLKSRLRVRAAKHGRSMEEEVRDILAKQLSAEPAEENWVDRIRRRFEPLGGMELDIPPREPVPELPRLDDGS